jgi:formylglycine-generating enzyme required for sulfatase activity/uncharacterized caspase-like protein
MMRWTGVRVSLWLAAMIALVALSVAARAQEKVALVIGNSKYVNVDPLPNPANDARVIAKALREIGFDVTDGFDLARDGMEQQVREFLRKAENASVRLFFYAGHGLQVDDRNYLVPVNTKLERASDLSFETIGLDSILENLDAVSRTNIIILDACRNNPFAKAFASRNGAGRAFAVQRGLAPSNPGGGTLIAYSTKPGAVALDGNGANSPFTEALARHLRTPGLEVRQMFTRVRADVIAATHGEQYPWDNSGLLSDVYLAGVAKTDVGQTLRPAPSTPAADEVMWSAIKDSSVAAVFDEFVNKFPASPHAREARARADELKKEEQKKTSVAMLPHAGAVPNAGAAQTAGPCGTGPVTVSLASRCAAPLTAEQERGLKPKDAFRECDKCPEMVMVPAGTFTMGGAPDEEGVTSSEVPQHHVALGQAFAVGKFAVTFDEWDACVADGGCDRYRPDDKGWGRGLRPVINISWNDAKSYVAWLSRKTGKSYRLLSEAEREYVTRAGTTTPFWWGSSISTEQANYNGRYYYSGGSRGEFRQQTLPADSFEPNPWGLYQVHGNVWEWTEDCLHLGYTGAPSDGSAWTTGDCSRRVGRGGSWYDDPSNLRAAYRGASPSNQRSNSVGLRIARTLLTPVAAK